MFVISALEKPKQEDCEFKSSLAYIMRPCLEKKIKRLLEHKHCDTTVKIDLNKKDDYGVTNRQVEYTA
jgi:hypothetical protein